MGFKTSLSTLTISYIKTHVKDISLIFSGSFVFPEEWLVFMDNVNFI